MSTAIEKRLGSILTSIQGQSGKISIGQSWKNNDPMTPIFIATFSLKNGSKTTKYKCKGASLDLLFQEIEADLRAARR